MKVIRAEAMGMCFGVRDALEIAGDIEHPEDVAIHGELVHNEQVLVQLESKGFRTVPERDRASIPVREVVMITAHGVSDRERQRLLAANKRLIDTTCPLVMRVHRAAQGLQAAGCHVIVIGRSGHVEVQGIIEDLQQYDIVGSPGDVRSYPHSLLGVICQSTVAPHVADAVLREIRRLNPNAEVRFVDTICEPTRQRQAAMERLLPHVDTVIVVGGRHSNNTRELVELCRNHDVTAHHVQSAADLDPSWFRDVRAVGLTAGTSTLDTAIDEVHAALLQYAADGVADEVPGDGDQSCESATANSRRWLEHFRHNAESLMTIPWERGAELTADETRAIAASMQTFQLGESGEGRSISRAAARYAIRTGDTEYVEALTMFIGEEQRHAAILGRFLDLAGIPRIQKQWTDVIFRRLRHGHGLELAICVLLCAELIAKVYYRALRNATNSPVLRRMCEQILKDEVAHVRFQSERLAILRRGQSQTVRSLKQSLHAGLYFGTRIVVWLTHARVMRAGGFNFRKYWSATGAEFEIATRTMSPRSNRNPADREASLTHPLVRASVEPSR